MTSNTITFDPDGDLVLVFDEASVLEDFATFTFGTFCPSSNPHKVTEPGCFKKRRLEMEKRQHLVVAESKEPEARIDNQDFEKVPMVVSSDILTVASSVFRAMFNPAHGFKESYILQYGSRTMYLPDDDPGVLSSCYMPCISESSCLPSEIPYEDLLPLALAIEKYGLYDSMSSVLDDWMSSWTWSGVHRYGKDYKNFTELPQAIAVTWVFNRAELFKSLTRKFVWNCNGAIEDSLFIDLPVPQQIINALKVAQSSAVDRKWNIFQSIRIANEHEFCRGAVKDHFICIRNCSNGNNQIRNTLKVETRQLRLTQVPHPFVSWPDFSSELDKLQVALTSSMPVWRYYIISWMSNLRKHMWFYSPDLNIEKFRGRLSERLMRLSEQDSTS